MIRNTILCVGLGALLIASGATASGVAPARASSAASVGHPAPLSPLLQRFAASRLENCSACCAHRQAECYNSQSHAACDTEFNNCVATCNTQGSTPSTWGPACWASSAG